MEKKVCWNDCSKQAHIHKHTLTRNSHTYTPLRTRHTPTHRDICVHMLMCLNIFVCIHTSLCNWMTVLTHRSLGIMNEKQNNIWGYFVLCIMKYWDVYVDIFKDKYSKGGCFLYFSRARCFLFERVSCLQHTISRCKSRFVVGVACIICRGHCCGVSGGSAGGGGGSAVKHVFD